jgi:hypothetical protein
MTWLLGESFQKYTTQADLRLQHTDSNLIATPITGGELVISDVGQYFYDFVGAKVTLIQGARIRFTFRAASTPIFQFQDDATLQVELRHLSDGRLRVTRNGTTLATSTNVAWALGALASVQFKATIHNTTGEFHAVFNGQTVSWDVANTNVNTRTSANNSANRAYVGTGASGSSWYVRDYWLCDSLGAVNNDFLGDLRIEARFPDAVGNASGWTNSSGNSTNNFSYVDDPAPTGDTDYVETDTVNAIDTYNHQNLSATSGTINAVTVYKYAKKTDGGACDMAPVVRYGGTDAVGATVALSSSYKYESQVYEVNPVTAGPWGVAGVNSAEFGHKRL